jgi:hypothetical protein
MAKSHSTPALLEGRTFAGDALARVEAACLAGPGCGLEIIQSHPHVWHNFTLLRNFSNITPDTK